MGIYLYLISVPTPSKKPTKKAVENCLFDLELARVRRPDFEQALFSGEIHKAERYPKELIRNTLRLLRDCEPAYIFTPLDCGRNGEESESVSMSIRAWILKNIVPSGILQRDEFGIVYLEE
jgi:hypothetical protein